MTRRLLVIASLFVLTTAALAGSKTAASKEATVVDQGAFGIFQNGRRVATEKFTIRQFPDYSVTSSEFHAEGSQSSEKFEQTSELKLLPDGSLSRYDWKEIAPTHSSVTVEPSDQFLSMRVVANGKTTNQPFFLTPAAFIFDDYFFSTREVLLWRYLASACTPRPNGDGCVLVRTRFPILIPRRRTSSQIFIEFKGYDDTPLYGRPQRLRHFLIQTDGPEWHLWIDSNHKLLRISIPETGTEILRQEK
ncbi:MAG: hypothetical protein CXZ00_09410 [Acidobacteria bacterium]|nr:MAG: hypothetical protein CXZ00_09410 [Acidobacteriota bacterium]